MGQELVYHCVMFNNSFVEVCAPRTYITGTCLILYLSKLKKNMATLTIKCHFSLLYINCIVFAVQYRL